MKVELSSDWLESQVLVLAIGENWKSSEAVQNVDQATSGWLSRQLSAEEISFKPLKTSIHLAPVGLKNQILITVGFGSESNFDAGMAFRVAATAAKVAASKKRKSVSYLGFPSIKKVTSASVAGSMLGCQGQDLYRKEKSLHTPDFIYWHSIEQPELELGIVLGNSTQATRHLVNLPPNILYPESFVEEARKLLEPVGISVEVWDQKRLESERCGSLLGVARVHPKNRGS